MQTAPLPTPHSAAEKSTVLLAESSPGVLAADNLSVYAGLPSLLVVVSYNDPTFCIPAASPEGTLHLAGFDADTVQKSGQEDATGGYTASFFV